MLPPLTILYSKQLLYLYFQVLVRIFSIILAIFLIRILLLEAFRTFSARFPSHPIVVVHFCQYWLPNKQPHSGPNKQLCFFSALSQKRSVCHLPDWALASPFFDELSYTLCRF
jgi:hypothetical protein